MKNHLSAIVDNRLAADQVVAELRTIGAIGGALIKLGYPEDESSDYGEATERGGVLVSADMAGHTVLEPNVRKIFRQHAGRTAPALV
ncbi:MAG: hypothetical protein H7338_00460 [Candidatus Sericytochromatia bacterium]|nr:hypothetical protein [Candidatus Sericytochromatia bacterium]